MKFIVGTQWHVLDQEAREEKTTYIYIYMASVKIKNGSEIGDRDLGY